MKCLFGLAGGGRKRRVMKTLSLQLLTVIQRAVGYLGGSEINS